MDGCFSPQACEAKLNDNFEFIGGEEPQSDGLQRALISILLVIAILGVLAFMLTTPVTFKEDELPRTIGNSDAGRHVFFAAGCASCHAAEGATQVEERLRLGGGQQMQTPFGTFVVPNISTDPETGIGNWSRLDFVNAVMRGVSPEGSHYYPAFPYTSYQRMTMKNAIDLKAFMDTLPAVKNEVGPHELEFPYSIRRGLGLWKRFALDLKPFERISGLTPEENRGAYLVTALAHCAECHTPRDQLGILDTARWLAGGDAIRKGESAPNITPHESGIGPWTLNDIAYALDSGFRPTYDSLKGPMIDVVLNMRQLERGDRRAIAAYLKTIEPLASEEGSSDQ